MDAKQLARIREIVRREGLEDLGMEQVIQNNNRELRWIDAELADSPPGKVAALISKAMWNMFEYGKKDYNSCAKEELANLLLAIAPQGGK